MHKGTFIGENKQSKDDVSIIQPVSTHMQQIVFGVTFSCPQNKLTFFQQHLYSLFLLLFYYGEQQHKKLIKQKIQKVIKDIKPKLLELSTRKLSRRLSNQSFNSKTENMESMLVQVQIKALQFTKLELDKIMIGNKLQLHSKYQRQLIRKALALIWQDNYHLIQKIQMSFFGISKIAGRLLNIQYKVQNYYGCSIIHFLSNFFIEKGLIVYIEINKEKETYSYIKQKTLSKQISNQKNKLQSNNSLIQKLMESSFQKLLKQQISIQYSHNSLFGGQEACSQYQDQSAIAQDNNNQEYLEQSLVLQDVKPDSFNKKQSQEQVTSKIKQKQAAIIIQQEPQINKKQHCDNEQALIMRHDENIDKNTSFSRKQNTKYSQNQFKNSLQIFGKVPFRFSDNQKQKESKFDKQQIQSVQSENNCAKSAKIISPKIQKKRKSSETFQQTIQFDDNIDLQQFVRCIREENFKVQNSNISNIQQENNMLEQSITFPIKFDIEGIPILENQQIYKPQNVATIVKTIKSHENYSQTQLFLKFSLQQIVEAMDQLQNYIKPPQNEIQKQNLNPQRLQDSSPDTINILIGIMKQQKQQYIWKFIENARLRINSLKNNTAFLQLQIPNLIVKQQIQNIYKPKNNLPIRRGQEKIMLFQQQNTMQKNNSLLFSNILSKKGLDIIDTKQIKRQQNLKDLSKLLNISNHPYNIQLNLKASKCFSLEMNMNKRN